MPVVDIPVTTIGEDAPVAVNPPALDVTVYCVIGIFPSKAGGVNATDTCPLLYVRPEP